MFALALLLAACGGGGGGGGGAADPGGSGGGGGSGGPPPAWERTALATVAADGAVLSPWLDVAVDGRGVAHLAYFEVITPGTFTTEPVYGITYATWDPAVPGAGLAAPETVVATLDNSAGLSLTLLPGDRPVVAYQGGVERLGGTPQQSDAMYSVRDAAGQWAEATAAIGTVPRNPVFTDGLAGASLGAVADPDGRLFLAYQYRYEGIDSMNYTFPDLRYVAVADPEAVLALPRGQEPPLPEEGVVEGNTLSEAGNIATDQNVAGDHSALILDAEGNPAAFYYARLSGGAEGLRLARWDPVAGAWQAEWVETGCVVGHVGAALSPAGRLAVAYYVEAFTADAPRELRDVDHMLRYAVEGPGGWEVQMVASTNRCGDHCSLAFDPTAAPGDPRPLIAYYEEAFYTGSPRNDLRLARYDGADWSTEAVATAGDIGHDNHLWIDESGEVFIATYSTTDRTIYVLRR